MYYSVGYTIGRDSRSLPGTSSSDSNGTSERCKYFFYDLGKRFYLKIHIFFFFISLSNLIGLFLTVSRDQSMAKEVILIDGMKIMFVCHVRLNSSMWVEIIHGFFWNYLLLIKKNKKSMWPKICECLRQLRAKCDNKSATIEDLKVIIFILSFYPNERNITTDDNWKMCWTSLWYK